MSRSRSFIGSALDAMQLGAIALLVLLNAGYVPIENSQSSAEAVFGTCTIGPGQGGQCAATLTLANGDVCSMSGTPPVYGVCVGWCGSCCNSSVTCSGTKPKPSGTPGTLPCSTQPTGGC